MWSLGARYCVRQDAHAFMGLWALLLALAGVAFVVGRRGQRIVSTVLFFFAACTAALGITIFSACYGTAPYQMGLGAPSGTGTRLNTFMCLSRGASTWAFLWTVIVVSCSAALGLVVWGSSHGRSVILRVAAYIGAVLLLIVAGFAGFATVFDFSWCSSSRLF